MKKLVALAFVLAVGFTFAGVAQDAPPVNIDEMEDSAILASLDNQRFSGYFDFSSGNPEPSTSFTVDITAQRITGQIVGTVEVKFKLIAGGFHGRIDFLAPETESGKIWIVGPDGTFFKSPDADEFIPVPGTVIVFGDATVAEVVGVFFNGAYNITARTDLTLEDGTEAVQFEVEGVRDEEGNISPNVTFPFATVTADKSNLRPITLELFGANKSKFHFNTFEEYGEIDGRPYFKRQLLDNLITVENQTLLDVSNIVYEPLPNAIFDPDEAAAADPQ